MDRERELQHAIDEAEYSNDGGERLLQAIAVYTTAGGSGSTSIQFQFYRNVHS